MTGRPAAERAWIGIDIGTSGLRVAAYAADGRLLAEGRAERPPRAPVAGAMVHDPDADWWSGAREALGELWSTLAPERVAGVGLAALFPAACLVAADGRVVGEGLLFGDTRAAAWRDRVAERLGVTLHGDEVTPRLAWIADTQPGLLRDARWLLGPASFVGLRLTGEAAIDPHSAVRWGGIAKDGSGWDADAVERLGIARSLLPPILPPTAILGRVTASAASATGLASGTPIVTGATDSFCQLLGSGVSRPGDAIVYYGSTGTLMLPTVDFAAAIVDPRAFREGAPYRLAAYLVRCGTFLDQLRTELLGGRPPSELDSLAAAVPLGADGVLAYPWLAGGPAGASTEGSGAIVGLTLRHGAGHLWRAVLEAFGYVLMAAQDELTEEPLDVVAGGGGSVSGVWRSIVTDQTGWPQRVAPAGGAARGAAFLAALATGGVDDVQTLRQTWLGPSRTHDAVPADARAHARYGDLRHVWEAGRHLVGGEA